VVFYVGRTIPQAAGGRESRVLIRPPFAKTNPNDQAIMYIALTSDSVTSGQLYDYASTQVGQRISIVSGVSRVDVFGTKSANPHQGGPGRDPQRDQLHRGRSVRQRGEQSWRSSTRATSTR